VTFLRQILTGEKKFFYQDQITPVTVPRLQYLNMALILKKVYDVPAVRAYLPDYDEDVAKRMSQEFLYPIVHRLDSTFFQRAIAEIEQYQVEQQPARMPPTLNIKPELLSILKSAATGRGAR